MTGASDGRFTLRDGRTVVIRSVCLGDAAALHELDAAVVAAGEGVMRRPEDLAASPAGRAGALEDWLRGSASGSSGRMLVAVSEEGPDSLVGTASISRLAPAMLRHVGVLEVHVHPEVQGEGLGRRLVQCVVDWARFEAGLDDARLVRLELRVREDNARAIALYESFGFTVESARRRFLRLPDGTFVDDLLMVRFLG